MSELVDLAHAPHISAREVDDSSTDSEEMIDTPQSEVLEGMQCGYKPLYAGPEDKRGRFKWVDTLPSDLDKPVEDASTAKWALIVRHTRVYNDPRRVLKIHSIVIQSPLLKEFLGKKVLKDYPGVTTGLKRLTFSGLFEPFVHRWVQLKDAIEKEEDKTTKEHAQLLFQVLENEFKETIEESIDLKANKVITYELLWTLFQPGSMVCYREDGHERASKPLEAEYGYDRHRNPSFNLTVQYVDFDGSKFGTRRITVGIPRFQGTKPITQLRVYPLDFHTHVADLTEKLIERGANVEKLAGVHYKAYRGVGWVENDQGKKQMMDLNERVVIDVSSWNRNKPSHAVYVASFHRSQKAGLLFGTPNDGAESDLEDDDSESASDSASEISYEESIGDMPIDGQFETDEDAENARPKLTSEQKLMCTPLVRGYAVSAKVWFNLFVGCVNEIEWNEEAFSSLVLPANQKELILGFTESQNKTKETFDDVIRGKGKGIILLLCGPPGVGKTLTAESVAEEMRIPLYSMSAGDLGMDPRHVELNLESTLEMCAKWNAVLLIDEADVFLAQRTLYELERNKLVAIFLRLLEYYQGIMFLTTNRVHTFDTAFTSRIHISINYPELSAESKKLVWQNFLNLSAKSSEGKSEDKDAAENGPKSPQHTITDVQLDKLAAMDLNGRQIKNVVKTARLLASRKNQKLSFNNIKTVLEVTQHLHNTTQETDQQRSALFA